MIQNHDRMNQNHENDKSMIQNHVYSESEQHLQIDHNEKENIRIDDDNNNIFNSSRDQEMLDLECPNYPNCQNIDEETVINKQIGYSERIGEGYTPPPRKRKISAEIIKRVFLIFHSTFQKIFS